MLLGMRDGATQSVFLSAILISEVTCVVACLLYHMAAQTAEHSAGQQPAQRPQQPVVNSSPCDTGAGPRWDKPKAYPMIFKKLYTFWQ